MIKYNDKSKNLKEWTSKKLKEYAQSLYDCIYGINSCYNCKDMILLDVICNELIKRGYNVGENKNLYIK